MCLLLELCQFIDDCDKCCNNKNINCCICICYLISEYDTNVRGHHDREKRFWLGTLICSYAVAVVILASISLSLIQQQGDIVQAMLNNWKADPIIDIQIQQIQLELFYGENIPSCPDQYEPLYNLKLPRIQTGCHCPDGYQGFGLGKESISNGVCTNDEYNAGCIKIQSAEPLQIPFWPLQSPSKPFDQQIFPVYFCAKRAKGQNFYNQTMMKKNLSPETCLQNNLKICPSNNTDAFYCISSDYPCPIKELKFTTSPLDPEDIALGQLELLKQRNSSDINNFSIYFTRIGNNMPLSEVKGGWGDGICINNNIFSLDPSRMEDYPLNDPQSEFCTLDPRFKLLTENYEERIYRANNILEKIKFTRPMYPINTTVKVGLYTSSYFQFKPHCRDREFNLIDNVNEQINKLQSAEILVLIFSCIYLTLMISIVLNELVRCFYECCNCKKIVKHILLGGRWCFSLILAGFIIYAFSQSIRIKERFKEIIDKGCTDELSEQVFQKLVDGINQSVVPLNTTILVMLIVVLIIDCGVMLKHQISKFRKFRFKFQLKIHNPSNQIQKGQNYGVNEPPPVQQMIIIEQPNDQFNVNNQYYYNQPEQQNLRYNQNNMQMFTPQTQNPQIQGFDQYNQQNGFDQQNQQNVYVGYQYQAYRPPPN